MRQCKKTGGKGFTLLLSSACFLAALFLAPSAQAASPPTVPHTYGSAIATTEATLNAEVNFGGAATTECRFEYGTDEGYGSEVPCDPVAYFEAMIWVEGGGGQFRLTYAGEPTADLPYDASHAEVKAALEALPALVPFAASLSVSGGPGGPDAPVPYVVSFQRPLSMLPQHMGVEEGTVPLVPTINGTELNIGGVNEVVRARLTGLVPATTYHYRLDLTTTEGTANGSDTRLHTYANPGQETETCPNNATLREEQHATFLPDCRAYELVSPPDKNGGFVIAQSGRTRAAADGEAINFTSLEAFPGAEGTGVSTDYISERQQGPGPLGTGWAPHAITPLQEANSIRGLFHLLEPGYLGEFSPDLTQGAFMADKPLSEEEREYVKEVPNLYLRTDLRSPGSGRYRLLTLCPRCVEKKEALPRLSDVLAAGLSRPRFIGLSADGSHAIFESDQRLTKDTPAVLSPHLFEWDEGTLHLAGRIPSGSATECDDASGPACVAADVSSAGQGAGFAASNTDQITIHTLSNGSDGHTRIFFTRPTSNGVSGESGGHAGSLYMREDGHRTVQLNVPEPGVPSASGFFPAAFWDASADGERAFFTTAQSLTANSAGVPGSKLYMWSVAPDQSGGHLTFLSADHEPADDDNFASLSSTVGVIGTSTDGSYVYFLANNDQLVFGGPEVPTHGIFLWHEGTLSYVGSVPFAANTGASAANSLSAGGEPETRVTPDGTHLLFYSDGGLTGYDQGNCNRTSCRELYLYDASASTPTQPALQCVSCRPDFAPATKSPSDLADELRGGSQPGTHENHALSDDGRYVFFSTAEALVSEDTNGVSDAYEYDSQTEEVHLLSSGTSEFPSYFLDASANGNNAFFVTAQSLLGWDVDTSYDLYDARVSGGFPEPPAHSAPCSSAETCKGALTPPPGLAGIGSSLEGPGNPKLRPKGCPKDRHSKQVRGRTVCAKQKKHTYHHKHGGHK